MAKEDELTLDQVYQIALLQYNALNRKFEESDDPETMQKLLDGMTELTHRLDLLQRKRMGKTSADISGCLDDLKAANSKLAKSLKDLTDLNSFLNNCSAFLGVLDQVIDLVKLV
jgi:uncharacterized membrane protein YccC